MSRVDVPTLQCDRCKVTTQDLTDMGKFHHLQHPNGPGHDTQVWDLCPACWKQFLAWLLLAGVAGGEA